MAIAICNACFWLKMSIFCSHRPRLFLKCQQTICADPCNPTYPQVFLALRTRPQCRRRRNRRESTEPSPSIDIFSQKSIRAAQYNATRIQQTPFSALNGTSGAPWTKTRPGRRRRERRAMPKRTAPASHSPVCASVSFTPPAPHRLPQDQLRRQQRRTNCPRPRRWSPGRPRAPRHR